MGWSGCCSRVPEVTSTARRTGRAELDEHVQGVESAEIDVRLEMKDRPKDEVLAEIRRTNIAAARDERHDRPADLPSHRPHAVGHARECRGEDLRRRSSVAAWTRCAGASAKWRRSKVSWTSRPRHKRTSRHCESRWKPMQAARYGIPAGEAAEALQTARAGKIVGHVLEGQVAFPLVIRYARDEYASDLDAVGSTLLEAARSLAGAAVGRRDHPARSRAELHHARKRAAAARGAVQRLRTRSAKRGR